MIPVRYKSTVEMFLLVISVCLPLSNISTCYKKITQDKIYSSTGWTKWCAFPLTERMKGKHSILHSPSAHLFLTDHHGDSYKKVGHEQHLLLLEKDASVYVCVQKQTGV
jgi:hypothetical protein